MFSRKGRRSNVSCLNCRCFLGEGGAVNEKSLKKKRKRKKTLTSRLIMLEDFFFICVYDNRLEKIAITLDSP